MCAKLLQLCLTLCDPMVYRLPGSSVHGVLQARILEWVVISSSGDLPHPGVESTSLMPPVLAGRFFTTRATREGFVCSLYIIAVKLVFFFFGSLWESCITLISELKIILLFLFVFVKDNFVILFHMVEIF